MVSAKPAGYRLATYKSSDGPRAGLVIGEEVFDAAQLLRKPNYATVMGILSDWKAAEAALKKAAAGAAKGRAKRLPLKKTKLLAPVQFPSAIYCAGANYGDHAAAMAAREGNPPPPDPHSVGLKPWHFIKAARTVTDPGATIKISHYAKAMDWEIELAAVIGRPAKDVPKEKALAYVAGYMVSNDLSARDRGRRPGVGETSFFKMDWTKHKTFEGSCPIGPWIVPASEIADPQNLGLKLWVNGELKQDSNTGKMLF
ncbi:MAG: fumarylacetoacetate hydrolase family protein, partial [Xanthobacteraceae bacterium]